MFRHLVKPYELEFDFAVERRFAIFTAQDKLSLSEQYASVRRVPVTSVAPCSHYLAGLPSPA